MVDSLSDFQMPEKVVMRLLKDALPEHVVISKDAKDAACRSASIFILQLSIVAAEKAQMNKRRALDSQDIIKAVTDLGLGEYTPQLVRFGAQRKRNAKRKESGVHKKGSKKAAVAIEDAELQDTPDIAEADMDQEPVEDADIQEGSTHEDYDEESHQED